MLGGYTHFLGALTALAIRRLPLTKSIDFTSVSCCSSNNLELLVFMPPGDLGPRSEAPWLDSDDAASQGHHWQAPIIIGIPIITAPQTQEGGSQGTSMGTSIK